MISMKLQVLNRVYSSNSGLEMRNRIIQLIEKTVMDCKVLFVGYLQPYVEFFQNCDVYHVIPTEYNNRAIPLSNKNVLIDGYKLPFVNRTFDTVVVMHLFEFSSCPVEFVQEFYRILNGGGTIISVSFNKCVQQIRCRSASDVVNLFTDKESFSINKIVGINDKLSMWPYNFSFSISKYTEFFLKVMPFISDVIYIRAIKTELENMPVFMPNYGMANG